MEQTLGRASTNTHTSARQRTQNNPLTHRMSALVSADLAIKRKGYSGTLCFPSIALAYILFFGKNYEFFCFFLNVCGKVCTVVMQEQYSDRNIFVNA